MTEKELLDILHQGENVEIECKTSADNLPKDIWSTYSAMANTNGGIILLGIVEDVKAGTFDVRGVNNVSKLLKDFWSAINNSQKVNKNILVDENVGVIEINNKTIIKIHVPRANYVDKPIYVGENPYNGAYKRQNDGDFKCRQDEVNTMIRDASETGIDSRIIEHYDITDIDLEALKKYRNHFEVRHSDHAFIALNDQEFLQKLGGMIKDKVTGKYYLTQAGLLLFGKGLSIREVFPALNFDYLDKRDLIGDQRWSDRLTIDFNWENNLYNFYTRVLRKIVDDLKRPFRLDMETLARIDDTPVHAAIREAFANAVIHSDYSISGTLRVERYETHFVFSNPGTLKLPLEEIFQGGRSISRNPTIQKCFRMIGYGESIGSGFPTIVKTWKEQHWRIPKLEENRYVRDVTLTLWMTSSVSKGQALTEEGSKGSNEKGSNKLIEVEKRESVILKLLKKNPQASRATIMEIIGLSQKKVQSALASLTEKGKIKRVGSKRSGYWEIID